LLPEFRGEEREVALSKLLSSSRSATRLEDKLSKEDFLLMVLFLEKKNYKLMKINPSVLRLGLFVCCCSLSEWFSKGAVSVSDVNSFGTGHRTLSEEIDVLLFKT